MANRWGKQWKQCQTLFFGPPKSLQMVIASMKLRHLFFWRKVVTNLQLLLLSRFSCVRLCETPYLDGSPPGSPIPGILQARTLEWVAISFSNAWKWKVKVKSLSHVQLSDPMDCRPLGFSIRGIFWARVLEWGAITFSNEQPRQHIKKQRHYFANKDLSRQDCGFSSGHVWMWVGP